MLAAKDEEHLRQQIEKIQKLNIDLVEFCEPDIDNKLTAFAFCANTEKSLRALSSLPLTLKSIVGV